MLFFSMAEVLSVLLPILMGVAFITLMESKVLASMQSRVGPDTVGIFGVLQPFADALKLLVKQIVVPQQAQLALFWLAPAITLMSALLGWAIVPFSSSCTVADIQLGWLFYLAVASMGIYGIIFGGWAGNSLYALLGGLSATAHMISYELVLSGVAFGALLMAGSFDFNSIEQTQQGMWFCIPLLPFFLLFLLSGLAEINSTPFDLVEAESELVSGFMTEHGGFPFVAYFLAEYSNILLMSTIASLLWLGGDSFGNLYMMPGLFVGMKALVMVGSVIWVSGTLPSMSFDQLMYTCWSVLLPLTFGLFTSIMTIIYIMHHV